MSEAEDISGVPDKKKITLTAEELKVLRECRYNAMFFRGIPAGMISLLLARQVVKAGYAQRFSGLLYAGAVSLSFLTGVGSYKETCVQKILALENSRIGDDLRKRLGLPVEEPVNSAEFSDNVPQSTIPYNQSETDDLGSLQNKRLDVSRWDEIRKESRQTRAPPSSDRGGISYDELRRRNRSNQGEYNSLTPEEEAEMENKKQQSMSRETATYNAKTFYDKPSSALDFSKPEDPRFNKTRDNAVTEDSNRPKRPYREGIASKNKYGDEIS